MITINIGNSYSNISGLTSAQHKELAKALSYQIGGSNAFYSNRFVKRSSLLSKRGDFATGLLRRVSRFVKTKCLDQFRYISNRIEPSRIYSPRYLGPKPYIDQIAAVDAAEYFKTGTIAWPTGTGKSLIIALIAARLGVKTLVVVPTTGIRDQLRKELDCTFDDASFVDVFNIDSPKLKTATDYGCLIIDEAHHSASKTYRKLNKTAWTKIFYRYFMTATPFRTDDEEKLLFESIAGNVIHRLNYKDAVKKKYIVPIEAYYVEVPKTKTDAYTWAEVYRDLIVNNEVRNTLISNLMISLSEENVLCLVKEVKHGELLSGESGKIFTSGVDEDSKLKIQAFNSKGGCLIGTTGILGEGINTKPCEYVVISGLGKAKSQFMQQVGRSTRVYPGKESGKIIIFRDKSHKFTLRHFNAQCKILLEEYGIKPTKLDI